MHSLMSAQDPKSATRRGIFPVDPGMVAVECTCPRESLGCVCWKYSQDSAASQQLRLGWEGYRTKGVEFA